MHPDTSKFVPWLKLEKDGDTFKIFSVHTENIILTNEEKGERG